MRSSRELRGSGYETVDLTDNEMAKLHVRHMVGGHAPDAQHERLCRFEFPERPGALANFLDALAGRWNISLFHYRNHGSDFGRVLAGLEVEGTISGPSNPSWKASATSTRSSPTTPPIASFSANSRISKLPTPSAKLVGSRVGIASNAPI